MVVSYVLAGAVVVGVGGMMLASQLSAAPGIGLLLGAAIGYAMGSSRALALRMQAQAALCQLQIETNTRRAA